MLGEGWEKMVALVRCRLRAFFPRGPTGFRALAICFLALLVPPALAANYALASCAGGAPITSGVTLGGGNQSAPNLINCYVWKPINCATGNQTEEQTDLVLSGRGPALHVTRTYNSQAAAKAKEAGRWGYGWSGPYSSHLEFDEKTGAVTVVQDNGATATFELKEGKYVPDAWVQATLVEEWEWYRYTLPNQEWLLFDSEGNLVEIGDRNGSTLIVISFMGLILKVEDAAGRELKFAYTEGKVTSIEDPMGRKVKYGYESGNLVSVTLPGEETPRWKFKYDASHQLTEMTDGRGGVTKTGYDEKNRAKEQIDPEGRVLKLSYGESGGYRTTTITEPNGSTTFKKFNNAGEPLEVIKAKGTGLERKSTFEYDSAYRLIKATDALSHSTTYAYNTAGDRTLEKDAEGNETKWTYNATHDVVTETTPKGEKTTYNRNFNGNIESIERPAPGGTTQKTTFEYTEYGDVQSATDPLGRETKFEYDTYGNLKAEINPAGDKTTWTYNKNGEQLTEVSPRGNEAGAKAEEFETKIDRDSRGRPIKTTDPLGRETKYVYDGNDNLISLTNALGHATKYTYTLNDELATVEKANGNTIKTVYNSMGQVSSQTNGNGYTTKYEYDILAQLTTTIDPLERKTKREYDAAGNLKKTEDALGRTISFAYDTADRLKEVNYSEAATPDVVYKYDKNSNVVEMVDGTGTTIRVYDQLGRPTEVKNGKSEVVKYGYDLGNQQTEIVYPNGKAVKRAFDKAGRLEKVTDWLGKETTFSYSRDSQLKATTFPAATTNVDEYAYNRAGEMTQISVKKGAEVLASMTYTRDKLRRVESVLQKGLPGGETLAYEYDTANRLVKGAGIPYAYDAANNITKKNAVTYTYDKAGQIATASNATFAYNSIGQRTKSTPTGGPATNYSYDQAGNLISTQRTAEAGLSKINETYVYDGTGLRVSESVDGVSSAMNWDTTSEIPLLLNHAGTKFIYGPEGLPIEQINPSEEARFLHHDQQGSTRLITVANGSVGGTYHYGPYGTIESYSGTVITPLGYGGQYRSPSSGLIYLRARVYDSITGQFLSVDPMVETSGEPYTYAAANPINLMDATGLLPEGCSCPNPPCRSTMQQSGGTPTVFPALPPADKTATRPNNNPNPTDFWDEPIVRIGIPVIVGAGYASVLTRGTVALFGAVIGEGTPATVAGTALARGAGAQVGRITDWWLNGTTATNRDLRNAAERAIWASVAVDALAVSGRVPSGAQIALRGAAGTAFSQWQALRDR
ncbi:MAG TPA: RHS repeat-associated core domain-containing protein [Solirubrobacterales bacterium]|nr:RHS repeat-associated core domain-containing protein [Solirubrobacterales bacterium]